MSDNDFKCPWCNGSGNKHSDDCKWLGNNLLGCTCYYFTRMPIKREPCPKCNKGRAQLAVECETCDDGMVMQKCLHSVKTNKEACKGNSCALARDGVCNFDGMIAINCPDCTNGYRPLTDNDVREMEDFVNSTMGKLLYPDKLNSIAERVSKQECNFNGSKVILIPKEG